MLGAVFLINWRLCLWIVVVGFLLVNGPLQQFAPEIGKVSWALSGLSLLLMGLGVVQMTGARPTESMPRAGIAWIVLLFLVYAVASSLIVSGRPGEVLAGFKRYFQTWGVFFALAALPILERDLKVLLKLALIVACLHLPFALYQFFVLVPKIGSLRAGAYDVVVGVFEGSGDAGGASGVMALYLVVFVAMLFRLWFVKRVSGWWLLLGLIVFCAPLAMGEAKVVIVALPIVMVWAVSGHWHKPRALAAMVTMVAFIVLLAVHFVTLNEVKGADRSRALENIVAYNVGSVGYGGAVGSLNRSTVMSHWWHEHGADDPQHMLFGHGLGASYFATTALLPGHLFERYSLITINLTTLSTLLWDLGLFGLAGYLAIYIVAWRSIRRGIKAAGSQWQGEAFRAVEISLLVCLISLPYNNSIISFGSHGTIFALTLGLCAYAGRQASGRIHRT